MAKHYLRDSNRDLNPCVIIGRFSKRIESTFFNFPQNCKEIRINEKYERRIIFNVRIIP